MNQKNNQNINNINQENLSLNNNFMMQQRTSGAWRLTTTFFLGMVPLLLCCTFISTSDGQEFYQWPHGFPSTIKVDVDYGIMWLIGIAIYVGALTINYFLIKFFNQIKIDTIPLTASAGLAMLNLFVIPHSSPYFLLLSLPSFAIIGYILGVIIVIFITIFQIRKQFQIMQNDPNMKEKMEEFKKNFSYQQQFMNRKNNNFKNQKTTKGNEDDIVDLNQDDNKSQENKEQYIDNPFVKKEEDDD